MTDLISVIIPTYNPDLNRLNQTLEALKKQTLACSSWELVVIDNNSSNRFRDAVDLSWHVNAKIVQETRQGLTYARLKGFEAAKGDMVILVDDDNVLAGDYLERALKICQNNPALGVFGGKSVPLFAAEQPVWLKEFYGSLALRDFGDVQRIDEWQHQFPDQAPIGAGMVIRKKALDTYLAKMAGREVVITDRTATSLSSGGDNDIVLEILKSGWQCGYFPELVLHHLIAAERLTVRYLAKLVNNSNKSWIRLLEGHGINPWPRIPRWTAPLRKMKAFFVYRPWKGGANYIRWRGACGMYDALSI